MVIGPVLFNRIFKCHHRLPQQAADFHIDCRHVAFVDRPSLEMVLQVLSDTRSFPAELQFRVLSIDCPGQFRKPSATVESRSRLKKGQLSFLALISLVRLAARVLDTSCPAVFKQYFFNKGIRNDFEIWLATLPASDRRLRMSICVRSLLSTENRRHLPGLRHYSRRPFCIPHWPLILSRRQRHPVSVW